MSVGVVDKTTGERIPTAGMPAIDNALSATSVNPVQNAVITAALANKQDKTDNNLQTTDKMVVGAINEHEGDIDSLKSGLIEQAEDIAEVNAALAVPAGAGKNRLPLVLADIKAANTTGTWSGNDYNTGSGITYTVNVDTAGNVTSIVANGTASANADLELLKRPANLTAFTNMIINGSVNGSAETWGIGVAGYGIVFVNGDNIYLYGYTLANGLYIRVISGVTVTNQIFTPMIRPATITDPTFAPYIPSVESRIEAVETRLESDDFHGALNISSYNTNDNMYVATDDCYIIAETTNEVIIRIYGSANTYVNIKIDVSNGKYFYMKKGMKMYVFSNTSSETVYAIKIV